MPSKEGALFTSKRLHFSEYITILMEAPLDAACEQACAVIVFCIQWCHASGKSRSHETHQKAAIAHR